MKKKLLYIHGFASAGSSGTATHLRNMLYEHDVEVLSPDVPVMPLEAIAFLRTTAEEINPDLIVATSMGAMYAEQLYGRQRILVNPSFHMAKLLTFRGLGRRVFRNKRRDGAEDFKVDKEMITQFREVEKGTFSGVTPEEKNNVWGLFGCNDRNVNCQPDFKRAYGAAQFRIFDGDHFLNDKILKKEVLPLIINILKL